MQCRSACQQKIGVKTAASAQARFDLDSDFWIIAPFRRPPGSLASAPLASASLTVRSPQDRFAAARRASRLLSLTILPTELGLVIACADAGSTIGGRAKAFARFGFARTIDQTSIHSVSDSPRPSTRGLSAYE
jgi:hypothetical protein